MAEAVATALASNRANRRLKFVRWVRRTHGWFGLWGAILGLMTGTSGIWLNHRSAMKLELPDQQQSTAQLALPDPRRPRSMPWRHGWAGAEGRSPGQHQAGRTFPARTVGRTGDGTGNGTGHGAQRRGQAGHAARALDFEFWWAQQSDPGRILGRQQIARRAHHENGFVATLTNLHKGTTMPVPWILLIDTLAGSLVFLSISGIILW